MTQVSERGKQTKRVLKAGEKSTRRWYRVPTPHSYQVSPEWFPFLRRIYRMTPQLSVPTRTEKALEQPRTRRLKQIMQSQDALIRARGKLRHPFPFVRPCLVTTGTGSETGETTALLAPLTQDYHSLPKDLRAAATVLGVAGRLANLLNAPTSHKQARLLPTHLRWLLDQAGWSALMVYLAALGPSGSESAQTIQSAETMAEAALLAHLGFTHDWCEHGRHHYFRPALGRRPEACVLHQKAARQSRWRSSPGQKRKRSA